MKQLSFSDAEYGGKRKRTRREVFLAERDRAVPWSALEGLIEPHYPKAGGGRRPYALATMLRIHCLQQWYGLSDPAMEEELYEIASMRQFAGLSLARERRRFGYRRLLIFLRREGFTVNHKRLFRIYREERLMVRKRGGRKRAMGSRTP